MRLQQRSCTKSCWTPEPRLPALCFTPTLLLLSPTLLCARVCCPKSLLPLTPLSSEIPASLHALPQLAQRVKLTCWNGSHSPETRMLQRGIKVSGEKGPMLQLKLGEVMCRQGQVVHLAERPVPGHESGEPIWQRSGRDWLRARTWMADTWESSLGACDLPLQLAVFCIHT